MSRLFLATSAVPCMAEVARIFDSHRPRLAGADVRKVTDVLAIVRGDLGAAGWRVASDSRDKTGPRRRSSSGRHVAMDAAHPDGAALWIETGRAWTNFAFLQHVVDAAVMPDVRHAVLAVNAHYGTQATFDRCAAHLEDFLSTPGVRLPLESVLLIDF